MIDFIKQWVINIIVLVLFIVMFEMLLPSGKMKKVVGLVTGTILIIAIISPLVNLLGQKVDFTALQTSNSNVLDRMQVEKESKLLEEEQMKQIVEVYRLKIIEQMEQNAEEVDGVKQAKADIIFNEDYKSKTFGEIKRAYLEITLAEGAEGNYGDVSSGVVNRVGSSGDPKGDVSSEDTERDGSGEVKAVSRVEQVKVGTVKKSQMSYENCNPVLKKRLEEKIGQVFGINSENIVISQMKR